MNKIQKPISEMRIAASEMIYQKFKGACVLCSKYGNNGASVYAVYPDGVREYAFIPYSAPAAPEYGQHYHATEIVNSIK